MKIFKIQTRIFLIALILSVFLVNFTFLFSKKIIIKSFPHVKDKYAQNIDNRGIPTFNYGTFKGVYYGPQRNPVNISQVALKYFESYQKGNLLAEKTFLNCADWLVDNAIPKETADANDPYHQYAILYYNFSWPPMYNMTAPWRSGMAQGQALQVLIRADRLTGDPKYLETAHKLVNSFYVELKDGGVTDKTESDGWWYEEYAKENTQKSQVLNGMIFSLLGLHEYYGYTQSQDAQFLFNQGVLAVKKNLPLYEHNGQSYYDVLGTPASEDYHQIHIDLSNQLYQLTGENIFKDYHDRWQRFNNLPFIVHLVEQPNKMGAAIFVLNFIFILALSEIIYFVFWERRFFGR